MKLTNITASFAMLAAVALTSCSEGQYWDGPENAGEVYGFMKPAETISVPADGTMPSTITVSLSRNNAGPEATVAVKCSSHTLTGPSTVTFPAGSASVDYVLTVPEGLGPGKTYTDTVSVELPENALVHVNKNNLKCIIKLSQAYKWVDKGTAATLSVWAQNTEPINIPVQQAVNYPGTDVKLMRLVSPYWYLEPEVAQQGSDIQFLVDKDDNAVSLASSWQYIGEYVNGYGYFYIGAPAAYGGNFSNEGSIFTLSGVMAYSEKQGGDLYLYDYETVQFVWSDYGK